jgi:hypothetical protein
MKGETRKKNNEKNIKKNSNKSGLIRLTRNPEYYTMLT